MKISIILPIYNVQAYLRHSIDSIGLFNQDGIEIILVNDGSTDQSLGICQEYAQLYNNVVVIDKENGGLSDARNAGIKVAKGEYIYFLDSDDWLKEGAIMKLYDFAVKNDCEVVQGGFYYAYDKYLLYDDRHIKEEQEPFVLNREDAMCELIKNNYIKNFAWGKIYKASIVKKYPNPVGKYFEDSYWQHLIINEVEHYGILPEALYFYRQRENAISGKLSNRILDLLEGNKERLSFIKDNYPLLYPIMRNFYFKQVSDIYCLAMQSADKDMREFFKDYLKDVDTNDAPKWFVIGKKYTSLLKFYKFVKRVHSHFFGKTLKRINL